MNGICAISSHILLMCTVIRTKNGKQSFDLCSVDIKAFPKITDSRAIIKIWILPRQPRGTY